MIEPAPRTAAEKPSGRPSGHPAAAFATAARVPAPQPETPLAELRTYARRRVPNARVFLKLEMCQPTGSIKGRAAARMVRRAIEDGRLRPGQTIVETSSGNTAAALASASASLGCRVRALVPAGLGRARLERLEMHRVEIDERPDAPSPSARQRLARAIVESDPQAFVSLEQFSNIEHVRAHREQTGPEIASQIAGVSERGGEALDSFDVYVAGVGTGASFAGIAEGLVDAGAGGRLRRCLVDPVGSRLVPLLRGEAPGPPMQLEAPDGIGADGWGSFVRPETIDHAFAIHRHEALAEVAAVRDAEGYLVGPCTGFALAGLRRYADACGKDGMAALVVATDRGEFYSHDPRFRAALKLDATTD
ncbi:MAG: pyridoxal-phosphate dependent enzyme [Planctomycetota bacterium]